MPDRKYIRALEYRTFNQNLLYRNDRYRTHLETAPKAIAALKPKTLIPEVPELVFQTHLCHYPSSANISAHPSNMDAMIENMDASIKDALVYAFFKDAPFDKDQLIDSAQLNSNQLMDLVRILSVTSCKTLENLMNDSCGTTKLFSASGQGHHGGHSAETNDGSKQLAIVILSYFVFFVVMFTWAHYSDARDIRLLEAKERQAGTESEGRCFWLSSTLYGDAKPAIKTRNSIAAL